MIIFSENYLYGFKTDSINNKKLVDHCLRIEQTLIKNFSNIDPAWYGNVPASHHDKYNLLTFPGVELNKLYAELVKNISELLDDKVYVLKSWLNVFRKGQKVDWHPHWRPDKGVWHGFYCAQVGNSFTEYRIPRVSENVKVKSEEGLVVIGKSAGDQHTSSVWTESQRPRVTIAFDIIPIESLSDDLAGNHFIPFKT
tara:strand:- start:1599 stop:2189 length:591 start_codon:yes stop_codon:yes gene_type:complete